MKKRLFAVLAAQLVLAPVALALSHDVGVAAIATKPDPFPCKPGTPLTITVTVENYGDSEESDFPVYIDIIDICTGDILRNYVQSVSYLDFCGNELGNPCTAEIGFPAYVTETDTCILIRAYTGLSGDLNPGNDMMGKKLCPCPCDSCECAGWDHVTIEWIDSYGLSKIEQVECGETDTVTIGTNQTSLSTGALTINVKTEYVCSPPGDSCKPSYYWEIDGPAYPPNGYSSDFSVTPQKTGCYKIRLRTICDPALDSCPPCEFYVCVKDTLSEINPDNVLRVDSVFPPECGCLCCKSDLGRCKIRVHVSDALGNCSCEIDPSSATLRLFSCGKKIDAGDYTWKPDEKDSLTGGWFEWSVPTNLCGQGSKHIQACFTVKDKCGNNLTPAGVFSWSFTADAAPPHISMVLPVCADCGSGSEPIYFTDEFCWPVFYLDDYCGIDTHTITVSVSGHYMDNSPFPSSTLNVSAPGVYISPMSGPTSGWLLGLDLGKILKNAGVTGWNYGSCIFGWCYSTIQLKDLTICLTVNDLAYHCAEQVLVNCNTNKCCWTFTGPKLNCPCSRKLSKKQAEKKLQELVPRIQTSLNSSRSSPKSYGVSTTLPSVSAKSRPCGCGD